MLIYGRTDQGRIRPNNEDCFAYDSALGIAVLADGMGGSNAGEVASSLAVDICMASLVQALAQQDAAADLLQLLQAAIQRANRHVYELGARRKGYQGMGTTLIAALMRDTECVLAHVGDSRAYLLRGGELQPLTRDHSMVQQWVDAGLINREQARRSPSRHVITRAVGLLPDVVVDTLRQPLEPGDLVLLCSDGLTDLLSDELILAGCQQWQPQQQALESLVNGLVQAALEQGGSDNVTVLALALPA